MYDYPRVAGSVTINDPAADVPGTSAMASQETPQLSAGTPTIAALADRPRWVAWRVDLDGGRPTKVPYAEVGRPAKVNDPSTWEIRQKAEEIARAIKSGDLGGVGLVLGDLGNGHALGGIDLDSCRSADGRLEPWAAEVIERFATYAEISPSNTGVKLFFLYPSRLLPELQAATGILNGRTWKETGGVHPPAIELCLARRYFTVTEQVLDEAQPGLRIIGLPELMWIITEAGPRLAGKLPPIDPVASDPIVGAAIATACAANPLLERRWSGDWAGLDDQSRSAKAMALVRGMKRAGMSFEHACAALHLHPETANWARENATDPARRAFRRMWDKNEPSMAAAVPPEPSMSLIAPSRHPCPKLPLALLGWFWANWVLCAAAGANAPPDYVVVPLLIAASALIGNARWVNVWPGWSEPPVLWGASVGNPSSGKSPGAVAVRMALAEIQREFDRCFPAAKKEWDEKQSVAQTVTKRWKRDVEQASERGEPIPARPEAAVLAPEPNRRRVSVQDVTVEEFADILSHQPKGVLYHRDELAGWLLNMSRYSNGNDRPFWLEAWTGGSYQVDRRNRAEPVLLDHLSSAVFGTIQPDRLGDLLSGPDDGLISRFFWAVPDPVPFARPAMSADIAAAAKALRRLAELCMPEDADGRPRPLYIPLAADAVELIEQFALEIQERETEAHGLFKSALGKARGQAARLALVLEFLRWCAEDASEPTEVTRDAVEAACTLMREYFLPGAVRVLAEASVPQEERNARSLATWIAATRPGKVNVSAIRDDARIPGLRKTEAVKAASSYLCDAGWLVPVEPTGRGGRPRGDFIVNPRLWAALLNGGQEPDNRESVGG